jgi:hypothetical protein
MITALIIIIFVLVMGSIAVALMVKPCYGVLALLLLMPFHTLFFRILTVDFSFPTIALSIMPLWKEFVIVLLLIRIGFTALQAKRFYITYPWVLWILFFFVLLGVQGLRNSPTLTMGLYSFRSTYEPYLLLPVVLIVSFSSEWLHKVTKYIFVVSLLISAFALYQVWFLGFDFIWKYYSTNGVIPSSFIIMGGQLQRAMGTFASPNQLGLYLAFMIILAFNLALRKVYARWKLTLLIMVLIVALTFTVSRSSWLALVIGLGFSFTIWRRKHHGILLLIAGLALFFPLLVIMGFDQHLTNTFTGQEIAASYHVDITFENLQTIFSKPLGVGFGHVGARALLFQDTFPAEARYYTESYILQLALEAGLPATLLFFVLNGGTGLVLYNNIYRVDGRLSHGFTVSACSMLLAALTHAWLIPDLQDITLSMYLWTFVGLGMRMASIERAELVGAAWQARQDQQQFHAPARTPPGVTPA